MQLANNTRRRVLIIKVLIRQTFLSPPLQVHRSSEDPNAEYVRR